MDLKNLQATLNGLSKEIELMTDERVRRIQETLLNLLEMALAKVDELQAENQKLRDENNRLKGEKGKPSIRKQTGKDISSESERKAGKKKGKKKSKKKKHRIKINRVEVCEVDKEQLPADAEFKGYESVVIQDIALITDNIEFKKERYYSASLKKTFTAELPGGYSGEFGPHIKALTLNLHYRHKMTQSAIHDFLTTQDISISPASIARFLTDKQETFHQEKQAIVDAGLSSQTYKQMDDTGGKVRGKNHYVHILCNDLFTAYFTRPRKDRLTIIDILSQGDMTFQFDEFAYTLMDCMRLAKKHQLGLREQVDEVNLTREKMEDLLTQLFPNPKKGKRCRQIILESTAIAAYQHLPHAIKVLLTDDAPQYKEITEGLALCWVHDGRHYKKLSPYYAGHKHALDKFLTSYWKYYHCLLAYKERPSQKEKLILEKEFDVLFSTQTSYAALNERIEKTREKKAALLLMLDYPSLPLHNNMSELGARSQARYRDISFHTMSKKGTEAKDTFMTLVETAKKHTVNTYDYFLDRIVGAYDMPALSDLVQAKATS